MPFFSVVCFSIEWAWARASCQDIFYVHISDIGRPSAPLHCVLSGGAVRGRQVDVNHERLVVPAVTIFLIWPA